MRPSRALLKYERDCEAYRLMVEFLKSAKKAHEAFEEAGLEIPLLLSCVFEMAERGRFQTEYSI